MCVKANDRILWSARYVRLNVKSEWLWIVAACTERGQDGSAIATSLHGKSELGIG